MKQNNLPGIDTEPEERSGRTDAHLGPSDSSDSASDLLGLDGMDDDDPNVPVDVALREDGRRTVSSGEALSGAASDSAGTGEGRSAGADAGLEAADIGVDRVFTPGAREGGDRDAYEDQDLEFGDQPGASHPQHASGMQDEDDNIPGAEPRGPGAPVRSGERDDPEVIEDPEDEEEQGDPIKDPSKEHDDDDDDDNDPSNPDERRPGRDTGGGRTGGVSIGVSGGVSLGSREVRGAQRG